MEILTKPSDSTAAGPRWVLLNHYSEHDRDSSADAKTTASSCTSSGQPFTVSFSVPAPPAASSFHGHWVGGDGVGGTPASDGDRRVLRQRRRLLLLLLRHRRPQALQRTPAKNHRGPRRRRPHRDDAVRTRFLLSVS